jgi:hypothetical protein
MVRSPRSYPGIHKPFFIKAINVCDIALEAFFEDTKRLVAVGVRADIARRMASASSLDELSEISRCSALRESSLASWLKVPLPLAYGPGDGDETFKLLIEAISPDDYAVAHGLPNWDEFRTTRYDLARTFFDMSNPVRPSAPRAPILRNGSFLPVLKVATHSLMSLVGCREKEKQETLVREIFQLSFKVFKIKFFPAPKPKSRTAGAPNTKPMFNSWGNLGGKEKQIILSVPTNASHAIVPSATVAYNNAITNDCNAEWDVNSLGLKTLKTFLCKTSLPKDFTVPSATDPGYVNETYTWVKANYDGTKPLHHLALLVAVIAASSLLPNLFMPAGLKPLFLNANSKEDVRRIYNNMEWISKAKKGMVDRSIFIGMFTTLIIAIYEPDSPLRIQMASCKKSGLGDLWTTKHCKLSLSVVFP